MKTENPLDRATRLFEQLARHVGQRRLLLVVDNAEHLFRLALSDPLHGEGFYSWVRSMLERRDVPLSFLFGFSELSRHEIETEYPDLFVMSGFLRLSPLTREEPPHCWRAVPCNECATGKVFQP